MLQGGRIEVVLKLREAEEALHDCVHVASVAKVFHTRVARSKDGHKDLALLKDLGESQAQISFKVELGDRLLCFCLP
jgi:hypothetical protein